jgi:molecular chaperone DnaK
MKKDAEAHAREDEDKRLLAEAKNKLDGTIFSGEKTLKDFADKVKPEDKEKIEEKIKEAKEVLAKSDATADDLNKASEELGQILQTVGAAIYQQSAPPTGEPTGEPEAGTSDPKSDDKAKETKEAEEGEVVQ